ncbi:MAG TPA: hypothetical protein VHF46_04190 [Rubrobacteraceae bacterium]|nr:hypothetical protein [Rubrobacteraceae bacterium]
MFAIYQGYYIVDYKDLYPLFGYQLKLGHAYDHTKTLHHAVKGF